MTPPSVQVTLAGLAFAALSEVISPPPTLPMLTEDGRDIRGPDPLSFRSRLAEDSVEYDIIGDVHGYFSKLEALLRKMGYRESGGAWRHPSRKAVFVGDFIDRGPDQLKTLHIVRPMVEAGTALAVMGNHELNAIAWATPDPDRPGDTLRTRDDEKGKKNRKQHQRFLTEVVEDSALHREWVAWFRSLPLWLELPELRVVHACWHEPSLQLLGARLDDRKCLPDDLLVPALRKPLSGEGISSGKPIYDATEIVTKGMEAPAPEGLRLPDKEGYFRNEVRVRWWDRDADTLAKAALVDAAEAARLGDAPLPASCRAVYPGDRPLFIGHYWLTGEQAPLTDLIACVDYSAGNGGPLCAYRWSGEKVLSAGNFRRAD